MIGDPCLLPYRFDFVNQAESLQELQVIVVEHFSASRMLLRDCLMEMGIAHGHLLLSPSPERVLQVTREAKNQYGLVIVSYRDDQSRWDGISLVHELERRGALSPGYCFVLSTDNLARGELNSILGHAPDGLLLKPFTGKTVKDVVQKAIEKCLPLFQVWQAVASEGAEAGLALLKTRLQKSPRNLHLHRTYATILMQSGRYAEATHLFKRLQENLNAVPDWVVLGRIEAHYHQGQFSQAKQVIHNSRLKGASSAALLDWKAKIASEQGDLTLALEAYGQAAAIAPTTLERLATIGLLARALNQHGLATKSLRQLVSEVAGTTQDLTIYRLQLARSHIDLALSLQTQAQGEAQSALQTTPVASDGRQGIPRASTSERELTQATLVLNQIRKPRSEADRRALLVVKARLLAAKKEIRRAQETIDSLSKLDANWFEEDEAIADALLDEARAHLAVGDLGQMERILNDIRQLTIASPVVSMMVQTIADDMKLDEEAEKRNQAGMRHYQRGKLDAAYFSFESAFEMVPDEPSFALNACQAGIDWLAQDETCPLTAMELERMLDALRGQDLTPTNAQRFETFQHKITALNQG